MNTADFINVYASRFSELCAAKFPDDFLDILGPSPETSEKVKDIVPVTLPALSPEESEKQRFIMSRWKELQSGIFNQLVTESQMDKEELARLTGVSEEVVRSSEEGWQAAERVK